MEAGDHPSDLEARVDASLARLGALSADAQHDGEALLVAAIELHAPAVHALVEALRDDGDDAAVARVAADPRVAAVLELHDLLPDGATSRDTPCGASPGVSSSSAPTEVRLPMPKLRTATPDPVADPPSVERCELCGVAVATGHGHGVDVEVHRLICLCDGCRLALGANVANQGRFRALPSRIVADPAFASADGEWDDLGIPVSTAFFFHDSVAGGIVAFYPGPAGATESLLGAHQWEALAATSTVARDLVPDTEAMLVRRTARTHESYLVPVDRCYELVGLLRTHWRGFDGGQDAHDALDGFFSRIRAEAHVADREDMVRA